MNRFGRALRNAGIALVALFLAVLFMQPRAAAVSIQTINVLSVSVANPAKSVSTTYTISLTSSVAIPQNGGRVHFQFYGPSGSGSVSSTIDFNNATLASTTAPSSLSIYSHDWNGLTLETSSNIAANTTITIVVNGVTNPSRGGYFLAHLWTSNYSTDLDGTGNWGGDYNSAYMEIGSNTNVTGTVTDANGSAVPFTSVGLFTPDWSNSYNAYTDKNGVYGIADVPAGTYTYTIYYSAGYNTGKTYFAPDNSTVTVAASGVTTKNASFLAATKTLTGKVTRGGSTAVTNGTVYVSRYGGSGYASGTTDSSGNYSFQLSGGTWGIGLYPSVWPADWSYDNGNQTVTFSNDSTTEATTKNLTVTALDVTVTGTIALPDGSKPTNQWSVGVSFSSTAGKYYSGQMDSSGGISAKLSEGTYTISGWVSDSRYAFPKVDNFTVSSGETKNLGTITLIEKSDSITGKVTDNNGASVAGVSISAWKNEGGYDYGYATTAADGTYTIKVVPGTYGISAYPQWDSGYVSTSKPSTVTVASGIPATKNFVFQKATNSLNVTIADSDGNTLTSLYSWVSAGDGSQDWGNIGSQVNQGVGTIKLPKGTWSIQVYLYNGDYSSPDAQKVTFDGDNQTKSITLKASKNSATLKGTVYDDVGNKVTGHWMSIYAAKGKNSAWQNATFDTSTGTYTLKLSAGTWNLGWWIDQTLGYSSVSGEDYELTIGDNETKTYDITLKKANATITGIAKKGNGDVLGGAWITADTRDPNEKKSASSSYYNNGSSSSNDGKYTLKVPAGTYFVGANMWAGSGYINPKRQKITVEADKTASVDLNFRSADATIEGTVKKNGNPVVSYVTAWGEDGAYAEANTNNDGAYSLSVSKGTRWHIIALEQVDKDVYKSKETLVDLTNSGSATQDLDITKQSYSLPDIKTSTFDPTKQQSLVMGDGTTILIPPNTIATSGSVTVIAEPTAKLAEESDAKPLSYGYNLTAQDQNGKEISTFKDNITIETKYTSADVDNSTVQSEDELVVGYYDKSASTWVELPSCTNNTSENTVTCQVNHFTTFAIVSSADTSPPSDPTGVKAKAANGSVGLSWANPSENDFKSVVVYRSEATGTLGNKVASNLDGTSFTDTTIKNGTTYYYTLRAVDSSGNESTNTDQVKATPSRTLPKTGSSSSLMIGLILTFLLGLVFLRLSTTIRSKT